MCCVRNGGVKIRYENFPISKSYKNKINKKKYKKDKKKQLKKK